MKRSLVVFAVVFAVGLIVGIAVYLPGSLPTGTDFSAIYNTDLALVHRIPIYDLAAVRAFVQPLSGVPNESFFLARFPYPAWYALSTFYLGYLPASSAATLWFEINLIMLFISVWLLTDGWPGRSRLLAFPGALLFLPVLGALSVGQYDFPVLLGASLLLYGLKRLKFAAVVCGAVLLTFKPHVGAVLFLFLLIWLFVKAGDFGSRALKYIAAVLIGFVLLGFIADPNWIHGYAKMLLGYQGEGNVAACSECISVPMLISRLFFDGSLRTAAIAGGLILILLVILFYANRAVFMKSPVVLITNGVFLTLFVSPYFYNYDFILLLIPFSVLMDQTRGWLMKTVLGLCFIAPYFAIGLYARNGNISLIIIMFVMAVVFYLKLQRIDSPATTA